MKTKTVTIHNWDGSKYEVEAPVEANYLGILSHTGHICFYKKRPKLTGGYYNVRDVMSCLPMGCPVENLPCLDGYGKDGNPSELLLKIEEV